MTATTEQSADRDEAGRFVAGHGQAGPGRPRAIDLRGLMVRHYTAVANGDRTVENDLVEVFAKLIELAKGGDVRAARIVLDRLCGPVPQKLQHDVDGDDESLVEKVRRARQRVHELARERREAEGK